MFVVFTVKKKKKTLSYTDFVFCFFVILGPLC